MLNWSGERVVPPGASVVEMVEAILPTEKIMPCSVFLQGSTGREPVCRRPRAGRARPRADHPDRLTPERRGVQESAGAVESWSM
jgi:hypothetical protein